MARDQRGTLGRTGDKGQVIRPELVSGHGRQSLKEPYRDGRRGRCLDGSPVARHPDESTLGDGWGSPSTSVLIIEPAARRTMVSVVGPGQGDEDIHIQWGDRSR